jgi:hypothetical protein
MFSAAFDFNQDLSEWDVSSGVTFVSKDQGIEFNLIQYVHLFGSVSKLDSKSNPFLMYGFLRTKRSQPVVFSVFSIISLG